MCIILSEDMIGQIHQYLWHWAEFIPKYDLLKIVILCHMNCGFAYLLEMHDKFWLTVCLLTWSQLTEVFQVNINNTN